MEIGNNSHTINIIIQGKEIQLVEQFCYLLSMITKDGNSSKGTQSRIGKSSSTFGTLTNIWSNKNLKQTTKTRLYKSLVLSTLPYASETWTITRADMKRPEGVHHKRAKGNARSLLREKS